jgi:hypothetical protein
MKPNGPFIRGEMTQKSATPSVKITTAGHSPADRHAATTARQATPNMSVRKCGHEKRLFIANYGRSLSLVLKKFRLYTKICTGDVYQLEPRSLIERP